METKRDSFFIQNKKQKLNKNKDKKQERKNIDSKQENKNKNARQKAFDDNRNGVEQINKGEKKPFDKKAYRLKKYSNKYKLEKWEEQRKKKMLHEYRKSIKSDPLYGKFKTKSFDEDNISNDSVVDNDVGKFVRHPDLVEEDSTEQAIVAQKKPPLAKGIELFNKVKQRIFEKRQASQKAHQERTQKLEEYKKKKQERFKKLSKKTKKGQPVMTGRLEIMLEKIQGFK